MEAIFKFMRMKKYIKNHLLNFFYFFLFLYHLCLNGCQKTYKFDEKKRKRLLIIGNGPSYKKFPFDKIDNDVEYLCVNWLPLKDNDLFIKIRPKYLCFVDPGFFDPNNKGVEEYRKCLEKVDWPLSIICRADQRFEVKNPFIDHINISSICYEGNILKNFFYKNNMANFGTFNVLHAALFFAINMNYGSIYMTGVDFNEIENIRINEYNEFVIKEVHGYEPDRVCNVSKEPGNHTGHLYLFLYANYRGFKSFLEAEEYAKYKGSKIYNLVTGSYIDAFEKAELDKFIKGLI